MDLFYNKLTKEEKYSILKSDGSFTNTKKGRYAEKYLVIYSGFDIETTNIIENDRKTAYMYIWQFQFNQYTIFGRHWQEFVEMLGIIKVVNNLREKVKMIIWVANLSFEFQFFRKWLNITKVFAKKNRQPLLVEVEKCIEFRECLSISGGSLKQLAKDYTQTQKLVGDLDYSIKRNHKTKLTEKELAYCRNDVVILGEFSQFIFEKYIIPSGFIPFTKTGILRKKVKDNAPKEVRQAIDNCYPNEKLYRVMMDFLFRGGYVHSNILQTDKLLKNVDSIDFKSSYPSVMFNGHFPIGRFSKCNDKNKFDNLLQNECCMILVKFYGIRNKTPHSIESKSKVVNVKNPIIDNGRIQTADELTVFLTELDYKIYEMFYSWDKMEIQKLWHCKKGRLPKYLLDVIISEYVTKDNLKKQGKTDTQEYIIAKSNVNSLYGMTVTKMYDNDITYQYEKWVTTKSEKSYHKKVSQLVLLPQWGIWVTALARYNLLSVVSKIGNDVVYCDTDSIKLLNYEKHFDTIQEYNNKIIQKNLELCEKFGYDKKIMKNIGIFDYEGKSEKFKTLGAKRYIYTKDGLNHSTIAGLPKSTLTNYCKNNNLDIYQFFSNNMFFDTDLSNKMTTCYNDEPHTDIIDGEKMVELSSVALYNIPFHMGLDKLYLSMILANKLESEER